jgi:predicted TIM-barrel fold metal-dependent hydrolase
MQKRLEGRDETILDPDRIIIDAHHHLFDRANGRYMFEDYLDDVSAGHRIVASVYVESRAMARPDGPEVLRPLGEVEFANGVAAMAASGFYGPCRINAGIVGFADLTLGDQIAELFERALAVAPERYHGIRQLTLEHTSQAVWQYMPHPPPKGILQHPEFRNGFKQLTNYGLSFDAAVFNHQFGDLGVIAGAFPETTIVLGHIGHIMALDMDEKERADVFRQWQKDLKELATHTNVHCKIGGLGLPFWGFGFQDRTDVIGYEELATAWKPYVDTAIETFGVDRCMMESNFPADARSCGYVPLWNAMKSIVADASEDEKNALFHGTAARVYRIPLDD